MPKKEYIKYDPKKPLLEGRVEAIGFKEGETQIIYIPSLRLSAYGDNIKEAKRMLDITLQEFTNDLLNTTPSQVYKFLRDLGWEKTILPKRMKNLSETTFEDIAKEFNIPADTPSQHLQIAV